MKMTTESRPLEQVATEALIVPVFEGKKEQRFGAGDLFDSRRDLWKASGAHFSAPPPGSGGQRVLLAGAGKPEKFDAAGTAEAGRRRGSASEVQIGEEDRLGARIRAGPPRTYVCAAVEGAILGQFEPDRYKTGDDKKVRRIVHRGRSSDGAELRSGRPSAAGSSPRRRISRAAW